MVTPSYNQAKFISDNLDSVLNQVDINLEHIVIDGMSDDGTQEVLRNYESKYNLKWISESDEGQSDAVNKGFRMASGEIIGWLNSDDAYLTQDVLADVYDKFSSPDSPDIIYGNYAEFDQESVVQRLIPRRDFDPEQLTKHCYIPQPATFMKSEVVSNEKLRTDLDFCMDWEYWLRLMNDYEIRHVDTFYSGFRRYPEQKSQDLKAAAESKKVYQEYLGERNYKRSAVEKVLSSIHWKLLSLSKTVKFRRSEPELAFDGSFAPLPTQLLNNLAPDSIMWG